MPTLVPLSLIIRINLLQVWRRILSVRSQSKLLMATIGIFLVGYLALAFWLFWRGLRFLGNFPGLGNLLSERLLFLLFAFLFVLLAFSSLVIGYSQFFRNRETTFLLALPVEPNTIFQWKFLESSLLASWAFLFLIAPLLAAYGMTRRVEWHFYVAAPVFIGLFIILPAIVGLWSAILLARYLDRRSFQVLSLGVLLTAIIGAALWLRPESVSDEMLETRVLDVLDRLLSRTRITQFPFLPSYWLTSGVIHWSEGAWREAGFYLLVLLSYAFFAGFWALTSSGNAFYEAVSAVQSRGQWWGAWRRRWWGREARTQPAYGRRSRWESILDYWPWMQPDVRALLIKDVRTFWRDTTQWGQTLVVFGLLGVYFVNLRHFSHQFSNPFWINLVSLLNLFACALNLATVTTRFVFPQFSLEGKRLWVVGLAPLGLRRVVATKFWLASVVSLVLTVGLMVLSCQMLNLGWKRTLFFVGAASIMSYSLNALAVGLGVLMPNFKEDNPGKIVSGFGGTFCLVLSFLYIVVAVILLALGLPWMLGHRLARIHAEWTWVLFIGWSLLMGVLPWRLAWRRIDDFECNLLT